MPFSTPKSAMPTYSGLQLWQMFVSERVKPEGKSFERARRQDAPPRANLDRSSEGNSVYLKGHMERI